MLYRCETIFINYNLSNLSDNLPMAVALFPITEQSWAFQAGCWRAESAFSSLPEGYWVAQCGLELVIVVCSPRKLWFNSCAASEPYVEKLLVRNAKEIIPIMSLYWSSGPKKPWDRECQNIFNVYHQDLSGLETLNYGLVWVS